MAEYLRITNDDGVVFIDDAYQNYHFLGKYVTKVKTFTPAVRFNNSNTSYFVYEHTLTITSAVQPLLAVRCQNNDASIINISYTETDTNTWTVIVYLASLYFDNQPELDIHMYKFGVLPLGFPQSSGVVFQVKDAQGRLIFDSGRKPMKVAGYCNQFPAADWRQVTPGVVPPNFSTMSWTIPNYSLDKTYAIINCSHIFTSMYQDPNLFLSLLSYNYRSDNTIKTHLTGVGYTFIMDAFAPSLGCINDSFILIDVTNY